MSKNVTKIELNSPMEDLKGVGPKKAQCFAKAGILRLSDMLWDFPRDYEDLRSKTCIADLKEGEKTLVVARVIQARFGRGFGRKRTFHVLAEDATGRLDIIFFMAGFMGRTFTIGEEYRFQEIDLPSAIESAEGNRDTFRFLLQSFHDNSQKNKNDIIRSYEEENYKDYTIYVHALKSTSKMIGALELSEKARLLEKAGKEENIEYIKESHDEVISLFDKLNEEIGDYLTKVSPQETEDDNPELDEEVKKALEKANKM